ncbi:hypothetical protein K435DRAFT_845123 [Dendrothele bispora CBS 962.96]|uniref:NAD(P)-binding protein n=1 Tax=Dendrothele bispora (strain CBS 962.96) TaxID=1314807 RepID=A0A4S8KWL7_DENBC|nr:hypothetical protein K435DRAFT_845123 [Dendrothele bispora CBS 962.96]
MQSTTALVAKRSCSTCSTPDHSFQGCGPLSNDVGATAWVLKNQPNVTSYQPASDCTALVPYKPSPFPPLDINSVHGTAPLDPVTGALLGFSRKNLIDTLHLAFPDPYIRAIITHVFKDSILSQSLSDDQLMVLRDEDGQSTRVFFTVETADRIWSDLQRMGQMVLRSTNIGNPSVPIPLSYSRDFNNLEWVGSDFSRLIPHITFAGSDNLICSIFGNNRQSMQQVYSLIQFVAQRKSMARLRAEKELARRRSERVKVRKGKDEDYNKDRKGRDEGYNSKALVLHPTASSLGRQGLLTPYTPDQPGWNIDAYAPSADVHMEDEDFGAMMVEAANIRTLREEYADSSQGYRANPTLSYYSASKFALEGFTQSFLQEMSPEWNIKGCVVQPGGFASEWRFSSAKITTPHPAYTNDNNACHMFRTVVRANIPYIGNLKKMGKTIVKLADLSANGTELPLRVQLGSDSSFLVGQQAKNTLRDLEAWKEFSKETDEDGMDGDQYCKDVLLASGSFEDAK